jgi:hypothetical protein
MKLRLDALGGLFTRGLDLFVCSASFEERCESIPRALRGTGIQRVLVCENRNSFAAVSASAKRIRAYFGKRAEPVLLDKWDPFYGADQLGEITAGFLRAGVKTIAVDVTTFTHEALLIFLKILHDRLHKGHSLYLLYNPADEYAVGLPDEEKWLCKGIKEIRSVLGYSGRMVPSKGGHLVVLMGFEPERTVEIVESYEPFTLSLGCGEGAFGEKHHHLNRSFHQAVVAKYPRCFQFKFPTEDPIGARDAILGQKELGGDLNTVVAPMNTKLSTIGAALAGIKADDIQLCYASARHYNIDGYSRPSGECIIFTGFLSDG